MALGSRLRRLSEVYGRCSEFMPSTTSLLIPSGFRLRPFAKKELSIEIAQIIGHSPISQSDCQRNDEYWAYDTECIRRKS